MYALKLDILDLKRIIKAGDLYATIFFENKTNT